MRNRTLLVFVVVVVVVVTVLVVVGNVATAHTNPPVTYAINWDSPETEKLARAACMDCHSNETKWPWYSYVAPASFLVAHDVNEGRDAMNLSTGHEVEVEDMVRMIQNGEMPEAKYLMLHPEANLSADQKAALIAGLQATFGGGEVRSGNGAGESGESGEQGESGEFGEAGEPATTPEAPGS